jgi:hypothetical protein
MADIKAKEECGFLLMQIEGDIKLHKDIENDI